MVRHGLSQPMSLLIQHRLVRPGITVFDYGCGQGDDLRALKANGIDAAGWDPHFAPNEQLVEADVVNLGFVLNVIEDQEERRRALVEAWKLARGTLAVSTMIIGQASTSGLASYRDGVLTSRGTFQKYFAHSELRSLVADTLGHEPVAVAAGIFFLFRRPEAQEDFLLSRRMGRRASAVSYSSNRPRTLAKIAVGDRIAPVLKGLAEFIRMRGRPPKAEEIDQALLDELANHQVSLQRAVDICLADVLSVEEVDQAAKAMRDDLLVHYALSRLNRSHTAERPSAIMSRDIRVHFGSQRELQIQANDYLMALADNSVVSAAAIEAVAAGSGMFDHKGRLLVDAARSEELPGVLRVYFGCASVLAGDITGDAILRLDFERRQIDQILIRNRSVDLPLLGPTTRIDLRRQSVAGDPTARILLAKAQLLDGCAAPSGAEMAFRTESNLNPKVLIIRFQP